MEFNLILGDDMKLRSQGDIVFRQGSNKMDSIKILFDGKHDGMTAYMEFDLPKGRSYVSDCSRISGDLTFDVPISITANFGLGSLQLVVIEGEVVLKSQLFPFEVTESVCANKAFNPKEKMEFLARAMTVLDENQVVNKDTRLCVDEMRTFKSDFEDKVARGEFKGEPGKDGANGKDGLPGKDGANGKDGLPGKDGTNGKDGLPGTPGKDGTNGKDGLPGKDGVDGKDGASGSPGKDGANGKDGSVVTIGENNHWYIDGVDTGKTAIGVDGKSAEPPLEETGYSTTRTMSQKAITTELTKRFDDARRLDRGRFPELLSNVNKSSIGIVLLMEEGTSHMLVGYIFKARGTITSVVPNFVYAKQDTLTLSYDETGAVIVEGATSIAKLKGFALLKYV